MTKLVDGSTDQLVQRLELEQPVPGSMGAATNRERIKKEKDKKRVSFKEAVYIVCFQQSGPNQAP